MHQEPGKCVGCGQPVNGYEYVGIGEATDAEPNRNGFRGRIFDICRACHTEPPRPLKLHYFHRSQAAKALQRAGASQLG